MQIVKSSVIIMSRGFLWAGIMAFVLLGFLMAPVVWAEGDAVSPPVERVLLPGGFVRYSLSPGMVLQMVLQTPISTGVNHTDDPVEGIMAQNVYLGEEKILSRNTRFKGYIVLLEPAIQGRNGRLAVRFNQMVLPSGETVPLDAYVRTNRADHSWGGEVTRGTRPLLSTQRVWGIGEYNRIVYGGPRAMGAQIEMKAGEYWRIILEQPVTVVKTRDADE